MGGKKFYHPHIFWIDGTKIRDIILKKLYSPVELHPLIKMFTKDTWDYHRYDHIFSDLDDTTERIFQLSWISVFSLMHDYMNQSILDSEYYPSIYWKLFNMYLKEKDTKNKILCDKFETDINHFKIDSIFNFNWGDLKDVPFNIVGLLKENNKSPKNN